jgi:hypothetical protein
MSTLAKVRETLAAKLAPNAPDRYDVGRLAEMLTRFALREKTPWPVESAIDGLRTVWPTLPESSQRRIICDVEVDALRFPEGINRAAWQAFYTDLRPPKTPFTVDYRCGKCRAEGLKLWRGVHGCADADGVELKCARCLAPDVEVDAQGKADMGHCHDGCGHLISKGRSDQIAGWLPAVPTDDTFWGYSSVPSADVEWWQALPTYAQVKP